MSNSARRNPVLLIHGIDDTNAIFHKMTPYLQGLGWTVFSLDLTPSNGNVGLEKLAAQVAAFVNQTFTPKQSIDLVGFSMGGIIGRYYIQRLGGVERVQRFITISSPHNGTWAAFSRLNPACNQMQPNSAFLWDLNQDAAILNQINFTSIWTPLDLIIVPPSSSELPVGKSKKVWVGGHSWMVTDSRSLQAVSEALSEPLSQNSVLTSLPEKTTGRHSKLDLP